jgi:DNA-binding response OmpR family regulator
MHSKSVVKKILIVEDDEAMVEFYREAFESTIFEAVFAREVADASSKINNQKFFCVIFDLHLKNRTSEQLISRVKTRKEHINFATPILLVSGQLAGQVVQSLAPYVEKIILKPFGAKYLLQEIQLIVDIDSIDLQHGEKASILVVDDDDDLRGAICEALLDFGFHPVGASNHLMAHKLVEEQKFDCILIDLNLDGVDGQSIILGARLQKNQINKDTPFIILSGQLLLAEEMAEFNEMAQDILIKPFSLAELGPKISKLITGQQSKLKKIS